MSLALPRDGGTRLETSGPPVAAPTPAASARELVAVLAAPTLGTGGTVFALRTGKNYLGAAPSQDVRLGDDARVSAEHAVILARGGRLYLSDRLSTNGTWVDGREVDAGGSLELHDRQVLRLGDTELVLLVLPGSLEKGP